MFNSLYNALIEWNRTANEREKLQHTLLITGIVSLLICGLISLLDVGVGRDLLIVPAVAGAIFLINAVLWSLLDSIVLGRLSGRRKKQ